MEHSSPRGKDASSEQDVKNTARFLNYFWKIKNKKCALGALLFMFLINVWFGLLSSSGFPKLYLINTALQISPSTVSFQPSPDRQEIKKLK